RRGRRAAGRRRALARGLSRRQARRREQEHAVVDRLPLARAYTHDRGGRQGTRSHRAPARRAAPRTAALSERCMSYPFGSWVMIDRLPDEPIVAFVYLDAHAGPSAKGGLASERDLARMPSRTVRLSADTQLRELAPDEIAAYRLPAQPDWLRTYGPQPAPQSPWHRDPLLEGKFH